MDTDGTSSFITLISWPANQKCAKPPSLEDEMKFQHWPTVAVVLFFFPHLLTVWWCKTIVSRHDTRHDYSKETMRERSARWDFIPHRAPLWWREVNLSMAFTQQEVVMATGAGKPSLLPLGAETLQVHCGPPGGAVWKRCGREACWSDPARTRSHQAWQCSRPCWPRTRHNYYQLRIKSIHTWTSKYLPFLLSKSALLTKYCIKKKNSMLQPSFIHFNLQGDERRSPVVWHRHLRVLVLLF